MSGSTKLTEMMVFGIYITDIKLMCSENTFIICSRAILSFKVTAKHLPVNWESQDL